MAIGTVSDHTCELLYSGKCSSSTTVTLNKPISNYNMIYAGTYDSSDNSLQAHICVPVEVFKLGFAFIGDYWSAAKTIITYINDTQVKFFAASYTAGKIYGIK